MGYCSLDFPDTSGTMREEVETVNDKVAAAK